MNAALPPLPSPPLPRPRLLLLAAGLLVPLALAACGAADGWHSAAAQADACSSAEDCERPARLAIEVQRDTDAILAGMAHARARLGLQEDAAP